MKTTALLASISTLFASSLLLSSLLLSSVFAQPQSSMNVPPPPGINDPGVNDPRVNDPRVTPATPADPKPATRSTPPKASDGPLRMTPQALPAMKDGDGRLGRPKDSVPDVSVRQRGDNSIQEYRRNGRVYMVVVTPKNGITQTYMVDPQGRLVDEHGQKPVRPVMYKVLEWGKAPPPAEHSSDPSTQDSGH